MKAGPGGSAFLYGHVAAELRRQIASGVYQPGARIPSQAELVREFGVSAITVRRALHELTYEGLLFGHQGLGVFVAAPRRIHRVLGGDPKRSIGDEIRRAGFEPSIKELSFGARPAAADVAERLRIARGATVWLHEKMIFADGAPVSLHRLHLPSRLGPSLRDDLAADFIFPVLQAHGVTVGRVNFQFRGATLGESDAPLFALPIGFPVIVVQFCPVSPSGAPILVGTTVCRADKFTFDVSVDRPQLPALHGGAAARRPTKTSRRPARRAPR
jgi:DNA-binding GntR family transcriptional regulator